MNILPTPRRAVIFLLTCLLASPWRAAVAQSPVDEKLPPPDNALLAKIDALADNTWLKLPHFKTAGDLAWPEPNDDNRRGGPSVRDYCNKMVWAPERKRALYCGAGHNVHPLNDVWEFDLASNTWICLYAPDLAPPRDSPEWYRQHVVLKDGVVRTPRGGPVRPAHTWWGLCYDTDKKRLVFWDAHKGIMFTNYKQLAEGVGLKENDPLLRLNGSGPGEAWVFTFDPEKRAWQEVLTGVPKAYEASQLEYLADRKSLWLQSGKTFILPPGQRQWKTTAEDGPGSNCVSAYDPATRTIVSAGSRAFIYSSDKEQWTAAAELPEGEAGRLPRSAMCFDSAARRFVLCTAVTTAGKNLPPLRLWLYDQQANEWSRPQALGDVPTCTNFAGYYDPARNVTVLYDGRDTWVWRGKKT